MTELQGVETPELPEAELRQQQMHARELWEKISELPRSEQNAAAKAWAETHGHLFYWCCGLPVFDESGHFAESYHGYEGLTRGKVDAVVYYRRTP